MTYFLLKPRVLFEKIIYLFIKCFRDGIKAYRSSDTTVFTLKKIKIVFLDFFTVKNNSKIILSCILYKLYRMCRCEYPITG